MKISIKHVVFGSILASFTISAAAQAQLSRPSEGTQSATQWFVKGEKGLHVVANAKVSSVLDVSGKQVRVSGRTSFHLAASEALLKEGTVVVNGFSLAYFGVPQQMLAGKIKVKERSGVLGFAANAKEPQQLKYDARAGRITGDIRGFVDAAYMAALIRQPIPDGKNDLFETVTQPATLSFDMQMAAPLRVDTEKVRYMKAVLSLKLRTEPTQYERFELPSFAILPEPKQFALELEIVDWVYFEAAKVLCIQPVRIGRLQVVKSKLFKFFPGWPSYLSFWMTGAGLAFGQPGANTQWAKADVVFNYRDWKTLWKPGFFVVDTNGINTSVEQSDLLDEVDDDDCIEVYFIDEFDPIDWGGGGATWGSGTAGSKIITSDANADGGVDFNHLAHEFGHVMGLLHFGMAATANAVAASSGTVMCPSGYLNDNPGIISQEDKDNLSNPLFVFGLKPISPGPDCQDSADCGPCP